MLLRPAYLSQKLTRPIPTKEGGTLRTILDARAYMLALPSGARQGPNGNARLNCCWRKLTWPISASRLSWRYSNDAKLDVSKVPAK